MVRVCNVFPLGGSQQMSNKPAAQAESILNAHDLHSRMLQGPIVSSGMRGKEMHVTTEGLADIGCGLREYQ